MSSNALTVGEQSRGLVPQTFSQMMQMATTLADSGMVPDCYKGKPGAVFAGIQMGLELGLSPTQALNNIAVINGRPSVWGDAPLALCIPVLDRTPEEIIEYDADGDPVKAICRVWRCGQLTERVFTRRDAERAKLWGKAGPWTQYPARMLQLRARGFALRDSCPDRLKGIGIREEMQGIERQTPAVVNSRKLDDLNAAIGAGPVEQPVSVEAEVVDEEYSVELDEQQRDMLKRTMGQAWREAGHESAKQIAEDMASRFGSVTIENYDEALTWCHEWLLDQQEA